MATDLESLTLAICTCGRVFGELREIAGSERGPRGTFTLPCHVCRDAIHRYYFKGKIKRGRLLVMQTIDLSTGEVMPERVGIYKDHESGNRVGDRGGERLPPAVLDEALRRIRNRR